LDGEKVEIWGGSRMDAGWAKDIMATAARVIDTPATWRCDSHFSDRDHAALCMISAD